MRLLDLSGELELSNRAYSATSRLPDVWRLPYVMSSSWSQSHFMGAGPRCFPVTCRRAILLSMPPRGIGTVVLLVASTVILVPRVMSQRPTESILTADNAYNPIPSPDGKYIAYVRTGWGEGNFTSFGRSSLVSDVKIMDLELVHLPLLTALDLSAAVSPRTLARGYFTSGWTPDSTGLVCYRDWNYTLVSTEGERILEGRIPNDPELFGMTTEWVGYSPFLKTLVWSRAIDKSHRAIETPGHTIVNDTMILNKRVVPSPDGRYLAVFSENSPTLLRTYDLRLQSWTDLGRITIHPDQDWWYIEPDWNPWFSDSSRLVFLRDSTLVITTPDGKNKTEIMIDGPAGLPVPSPDGQSIAYVTFGPRPMQTRRDLQFWGGTTILVVLASAGSEPRTVTLKNPDEVYDLKWLGNDTLVFDRVADEVFYRHARIWKATVPR